MQFLNALSCTYAVKDWLTISRQPRILHIFDHACNLINEHREVLSIVTPQIGNGPFNSVLQEDIVFADYLDIESPITVSADQLSLGNLLIDITAAKVWNPCPHWATLHDRCDQISAQVEQLPINNYQFSNSLSSSLAIADLHSALLAAKQLAGLGFGLTPAGDDFIMGALYAAWIIHPREVASALAEAIANIAAPLTTSLSAAWIRSAGRGGAGILWHDLFNSLILPFPNLGSPVSQILSTGATSGADALAGFIHTFISYAEHENHVFPKLLH